MELIRPESIEPIWDCKKCALHKTAKRPCWGRGPANVELMLVGQSPGKTEDETGIPFNPNAPAGGLITDVLAELGVKRSEIYITNAVRCFEGFNGKVTPDAIKACKPYLLEEIEAVNPKYIILAGNNALKAIFGHEGITKEHGTLKIHDGRSYFPIFHPASAIPSRYPENRVKIKNALKSLIARIRQEQDSPAAASVQKYGYESIVIDDEDKLDAFEKDLFSQPEPTLMMVDLETNGLKNNFQFQGALIGGMSVAWRTDRGYYLPIDHQNPVVWTPRLRIRVVDLVIRFAKSSYPKGNQSIKFDYNFIRAAFGVRLNSIVADPMLASHLVDPGESHGLDHIAWRVGMGGYEQGLEQYMAENKIVERDYTKLPLGVVGPYAVGDAVCALRGELYFREIIKKRGQLSLYQNQIIPGIEPYADIEANGILVDVAYLDKLEKYYVHHAAAYRKRLLELAGKHIRAASIVSKVRVGEKVDFDDDTGKDFNFDSPEQVGVLLHEWFDIDKRMAIIRRSTMNGKRDYSKFRDSGRSAREDVQRAIQFTAKGRLSTGKGVLRAVLACFDDLTDNQREFINVFLKYKAGQKRYSTSVKGIRTHLCHDSRVRSTYLLHGTDTGRRSSRDPNLQNVPRENMVKRIFVALPDHFLLLWDYQNLEARVAACMSGDEKLLAAFNAGKDVHSYTTSLLFKLDYNDMIRVRRSSPAELDSNPVLAKKYKEYDDKRDIAKRCMWTMLFGGGPTKISLISGIPVGEAEWVYNSMLSEFSGLKKMFKQLENFAEDRGYARNDFGRRRYLMGINSSDSRVYSDALRQALNTPIQGTAGQITYLAVTAISSWFRANSIKASIVQEVHDSVAIEVRYDRAYDVAKKVKSLMEGIESPSSKGKVKFEVDGFIGCHLGSKQKLTDDILYRLYDDPRGLYLELRRDLDKSPSEYDIGEETDIIEDEDF